MNKNVKPLISIVLPTYNVSSHIERCMRSLQNQVDPDFEMVFVDDCGSDNSIEIVERYAKDDPRIRIIKNKTNQGTLTSRQNGAIASKGDYVFLLILMMK